MEQKDIDYAASAYACNWYSLGRDNDVAREAFIDGAKWALKHQWVSVKNRLPEDGQVVFCISPFGGYKAYYHEYKNEFHDTVTEYALNNVLYWMEIPVI